MPTEQVVLAASLELAAAKWKVKMGRVPGR